MANVGILLRIRCSFTLFAINERSDTRVAENRISRVRNSVGSWNKRSRVSRRIATHSQAENARSRQVDSRRRAGENEWNAALPGVIVLRDTTMRKGGSEPVRSVLR